MYNVIWDPPGWKMLCCVNKNIYTFLISYSHLVQMQDQKDCSLDSWNCHKKWVHVTQSQELINRVPVLHALYNLRPVMRINEQCTVFCFSFKVFVMRFQILKAARNAVTLLVTKRLLKVAQNQNISVKRTERSKVEAWARDNFYPITVRTGEQTPTQGTACAPALELCLSGFILGIG